MSRMSRVSTRVSSVHAEKNLKRGYNEFSKVARKSDKAQNAENQLKHFDCELTVMLMLHERGSPPGSFVRRLVHMSDNLKYAKFQQWALVTLYGKDCKHPKDYLAFEYVNDVGKVVGISNYDELRGWMNKMWFQHPLELHVIEKGAKKHSHMQVCGASPPPSQACAPSPRRALSCSSRLAHSPEPRTLTRRARSWRSCSYGST